MAVGLKFNDVVVEFPKIKIGGKNDRIIRGNKKSSGQARR